MTPLLQIVKYHEQRKELHSIPKEAAKFCKELSIPELPKDETNLVTAYAKRVKKMAKHHGQQKLQESWKERMMHGKYPKMLKDPDVDQQKTNQWLRSYYWCIRNCLKRYKKVVSRDWCHMSFGIIAESVITGYSQNP